MAFDSARDQITQLKKKESGFSNTNLGEGFLSQCLTANFLCMMGKSIVLIEIQLSNFFFNKIGVKIIFFKALDIFCRRTV